MLQGQPKAEISANGIKKEGDTMLLSDNQTQACPILKAKKK